MRKSLLSIDVEAHLQKIAAHTYGSRHHYPVELVRLAIARGANRIQVRIKADLLEIEDDGTGISNKDVDELYRVLDRKLGVEDREKAILHFKTPRSIGLLALFSPNPQKVIIENIYKGNPNILVIQGNNIKSSQGISISGGTRLQLFRREPQWTKEIEILEDYCRDIPQELTVNGKSVKRSTFLNHPMVSLNSEAQGAVGHACIGIPARGDLCCVWLLHNGIPWYRTMLSPWQGFVFEISVEYGGELTQSLLHYFLDSIERLYRKLAQGYPGYPAPYQVRVEELLFLHSRLTGTDDLVNAFSPFTLAGNDDKLNLTGILKIKESEKLYAIPGWEKKNDYDPSPGNTLILNRNQLDFLVNHKRVSLTFPPPRPPSALLKRFVQRMVERFKKGITGLMVLGSRIVPSIDLKPNEQVFLELLSSYLGKDRILPPGTQPVMVRGWGLPPLFEKSPYLMINRSHPLVKKAVIATEIEAANIEFAASLIM